MPAERIDPKTVEPRITSTPAGDPPAAASTGPRHDALGRAVGSGFSWLSLSFLVGKAFSFLAQIVLGILLLDEEFGVFAIATSVATFAKVFHDGGIAQLLIQRGPAKFEELGGPGFWMGMVFSVLAATALAAAAPAAAAVYGDPELAVLLWIIAFSLPLAAPAQVQRAKLRMDLKFRSLALITASSYFVRHLGSIALAYQGFGARSFVLPLLAVALFEDTALTIATRARLWRKRPNLAAWPSLLESSAWVIAISVFSGFVLYGDYLVLGLLLERGTLGQYFFGCQLTMQVAALMSVNLQYVMLPVLSRMADDRSRQAAALVRTFRVLMLVMAPLSMALAVGIEPLESLIWKGKWSAVVPLMQILSFAAPVRLFTIILHATLMSQGQFRTTAFLTMLEGITFTTAAALGYTVGGSNLTVIGLTVAAAQIVYCIGLSVVLMRRWGVWASTFFRAFAPGWGLAMAAAGATIAISRAFFAELPPAVELALSVTLFYAAFVAAMRLLCASHFSELFAVAPKRLANTLRRLLLFGANS